MKDFEKKLSWKETGGVLEGFDDGHVPENFKSIDDDDDENTTGPNISATTSTRIVNYPDLFDDDKKSSSSSVLVYNDAVRKDLVDTLYEKTCDESTNNAWGDYVTLEDVVQYWSNDDDQQQQQQSDDHGDSTLVEVVARYLQLAMKKNVPSTSTLEVIHGVTDEIATTTTTTSDSCLMTEDDLLKRAHGVAIWGLKAKVGTSVDYHLDYAEQVRYQYNIINPPLLAGTLQCTKDKIEGGNFLVSLDGIDHYKRHGYKGKIRNVDCNEMINIPYRYGQMICHLGNLPHASSTIQSIQGDQDRVIIGFNVFCKTVGPLVSQAPEHSDAFRRLIQFEKYLHRETKKHKQIDIKYFLQNKTLAKLLVLSKREQQKKEFQCQMKSLLDKQIPQKLPSTVGELMKQLTEDCSMISPEDIRVYLHLYIRRGKYKVVHEYYIDSSDQLVAPTVEIDLP
jgi:hypothetical protein